MDKIAIGIPAYGGQVPHWWKPLVIEASKLSEYGIELIDLLDASSMATDFNRNSIARRFLETDADWLFWIDADNPPVIGAIRRLLDTHKEVVSGFYVTGSGDPKVIAYFRQEDGRYSSIANLLPGEILRVDAVGMGHLLTHRSVYEEIDKNFVCLQRATGGLFGVHKDDIEGDIFSEDSLPSDGTVVDGQFLQRVYYPPEGSKLPYFALEYGRTEDIYFCELLQRLGIPIWLDTSIMVGHVKAQSRSPREYFEWLRKQ